MPQCERTSQPGCVVGIFSFAKSKESEQAKKDGVGGADTSKKPQMGLFLFYEPKR